MLGKAGYDYSTFNILQDERIRQWIKVYTKSPTLPQVSIDKKFVGGIDVVTELIENDEFDEMIPKSCKPLPPKEQALKVACENKIVLLLNGTPSVPKDEASKSMVMQIQSMNQPFMFLDVEGQPEYLTAFPKTNVPYLILDGKPACGVDGIDQLGL